MSPTRTVIVGRGRAGGSFAEALAHVGWSVELVDHLSAPDAVAGCDLVLLCVPDSAVGAFAAGLPASPDRVVLHCSGSLGLDVLAPHPQVGSVHPLVALSDARSGARRLHGAWFAVCGHPVTSEVVGALAGHEVEVQDRDRVRYHAAAVVASNHLVALLGQVERIAAGIGVPPEAFLALVAATVENVAEHGASAALTGPVSRGDWETVARHVEALDPSERDAYIAMAAQAARLAGSELPELRGERRDR